MIKNVIANRQLPDQSLQAFLLQVNFYGITAKRGKAEWIKGELFFRW